MEHSTLHALQLTGLLIALGAPILVLGLLWPARKKLNSSAQSGLLAGTLEKITARVAAAAALGAALAASLDFFVQVAEAQGVTIFGGAGISDVVRLISTTDVGRFGAARILFLLMVVVFSRLPFRFKWWLMLASALAAVACGSLVSHAAAQPEGRELAVLIQALHISAGAAWIGILIHLLASRREIAAAQSEYDLRLISEVVRGFSPVALTAASVLALSGVVAAVRFLVHPGSILTSAYGLTLIVKLSLLVPVLVAGYTNFRVVRPALARLPEEKGSESAKRDPRSILGLFGRMLELEVTAGILVVAVAGILGSVSPPFESTAVRLTTTQVSALLSPDAPTASIINPGVFYGAPVRTVDDLRYSEFTHNWSGIMVTLLGLFWLFQSMRGSAGELAGRAWPFLMIPFAAFIAVAADPEVFILGQLSYWQALKDPQILEHQIGALLMLIIIWFGWRDRKRPETERPLGFILPALMILGSLLLLGHAHSFLTNSPELTNLINVQHAVIGACGLFAGTVRWLELRSLFPHRAARILWPGFVVVLGLIMAFFYREVV